MSNWETDYGICALADCREYLQSMRENSVDMIFTDPAYKGVSGGRTSPASQSYGWNSSVLDKNDGKIFKHNSIKIREYIHLLQRVLKPGGHCYIMINRLNLRDLLNAAHECNFHLTNILAWAKNNKNANRFFMIETEFICMFYNKPATPINDCGQSQIFYCPTPKDKLHRTQKPIELMQHYIEQSSKPGEVVLDNFAGSGSTAIAAIKAGRKFICIESDQKHFDNMVGRIWDFTN